MKVNIPLDGGFYESEALPLSAQRCVNWYVNIPQTNTWTQSNLFGTPGIEELTSVSATDTCRGSHVMAGIPYFVIGAFLHRLNRTIDDLGIEVFTTTNLGQITGTGRVAMADNGTQLCLVVPGGDVFIFIEPDVLSIITDVNFDGPVNSVVFIDGYFVFTKSDGKKFINSPLLDGRGAPEGTAYDVFDFSTAEADPDQIKGVINFQNQLFVLGSVTTEVYTNIGRTPAPFERIQGFIMHKGLSAPYSLVVAESTYVFVGGSTNEAPSVWAFDGNSHVKLSTTPIDQILSNLTLEEIESIYAWSYAQAGTFFIGFKLPDTCLVYDFMSKKWHERLSYTEDTADIPYRVCSIVKAYGDILLGDALDGRIGRLARNTFTEYGLNIRRILTTMPLDKQGEDFFVSSVEAVMESGMGTLEYDPIVRLSWSDTGGYTYNNELQRTLGKQGEYRKRAIWRRLGRGTRSRVFKFELSEAIRPSFIKAEIEIG